MKPQPKGVKMYTEKHLENFSNMIKSMYAEEQLTDVTLHCKDGTLKAHKIILAAGSPYFKNMFIEHNKENVALILHGISFEHLKIVIEIMYHGYTDVNSDIINSVLELVEEFDVRGVLMDHENQEAKTNGYGRDTRFKGQKRVAVDFKEDDPPAKINRSERHSVDTKKSNSPEKKTMTPEKRPSISESPAKKTTTNQEGLVPIKQEPLDVSDLCSVSRVESVKTDEVIYPILHHFANAPAPESKLSSWDKKPRKFQCELCPSSFKRASHLTRHQLVHTGERPYACDQCDKAFSRHDKLKHHVKKNHETDNYIQNGENMSSGEYQMGTIRLDNLTPEVSLTSKSGSNLTPKPYSLTYDDNNHIILSSSFKQTPPRINLSNLNANKHKKPMSTPQNSSMNSTPNSTINSTLNSIMNNSLNSSLNNSMNSSLNSTLNSSLNMALSNSMTKKFSTSGKGVDISGLSPQKKGRGRPRKYPLPPPNLIKRPRGRPRLNPLGAPQIPGRHSTGSYHHNYDFTNLPFGDLEFLTKSMHENIQSQNISMQSQNMSMQSQNMSMESHNESMESQSMEPQMMEPFVEINDDEENEENEENHMTFEPEVHMNISDEESLDIKEEMEAMEKIELPPEETPKEITDVSSFLGTIGLCENKLGKIGECTLSIAEPTSTS